MIDLDVKPGVLVCINGIVLQPADKGDLVLQKTTRYGENAEARVDYGEFSDNFQSK